MITFNLADISYVPLKHKKLLKKTIVNLFEMEGKRLAEISYVFSSDKYLLELNKNYLNHDYYTDIITFDLSNTEEVKGDIYISYPRVKENSFIHDTTVSSELLRVIFHGALHLCGYKDKKKSEITIMRQKEEGYLFLFEELLKNSST